MSSIPKMDRREFLQGAALASAGVALGLGTPARAEAAPATRTLSSKVTGFPGKTQEDAVRALDAWYARIGFYPYTVLWFELFGEYDIPGYRFAAQQGVVPTVTLEPMNVSLAAINRGEKDAWLDRFAATVGAHPGPVRVRFAHEMNGDWYPWGRQPKAYRDAFRRVASRIKAKAPRARMVWCPNVDPGQDDLRRYYPGDAYVNVLSLDGYDFHYGQDTFTEIFASSYNRLVSLNANKPVTIEETATGEGAHKPAWIRDAFLTAIPKRLPRVSNVNWFDVDKEQDWRLDSSARALAAYKNVEASSSWRGRN